MVPPHSCCALSTADVRLRSCICTGLAAVALGRDRHPNDVVSKGTEHWGGPSTNLANGHFDVSERLPLTEPPGRCTVRDDCGRSYALSCAGAMLNIRTTHWFRSTHSASLQLAPTGSIKINVLGLQRHPRTSVNASQSPLRCFIHC